LEQSPRRRTHEARSPLEAGDHKSDDHTGRSITLNGAAAMQKALIKTAFWIVTLALFIALLVPAQFVLEAMLPRGDRVLVGVVVAIFCLLFAGRLASFLLRASRITDERLTVFGARRQRSPRP
jgi:hypothetical protein